MSINTIARKINTYFHLFSTPRKMILPLSRNGLLKWIPDELFLKIVYWGELDRKLDLESPNWFSEKIQWLKLHDRNPEYVNMVDKLLVKDIVADRIGREYIIPTYGSWDSAESIDFDSLPNAFVIKCNHDSGGIAICRDKASFDRKAAVSKLADHLKRDAYYFGREWPYKGVKKKIIAEKLLIDPEKEDLVDYKIFCFGGEPKYCQVIKNRNSDETIDFYDLEWNRMPFTGLGLGLGPKKGGITAIPINYAKMIEIAKELAKGTIFVRIDLYNIAGRIFFGEFTLYPKSGFGKFFPEEWNLRLGDMINL